MSSRRKAKEHVEAGIAPWPLRLSPIALVEIACSSGPCWSHGTEPCWADRPAGSLLLGGTAAEPRGLQDWTGGWVNADPAMFCQIAL